jgi:hypothetical protein
MYVSGTVFYMKYFTVLKLMTSANSREVHFLKEML